LWLVSEEPGLADVIGEQRELLARLRAVVEAKDAENQVLPDLAEEVVHEGDGHVVAELLRLGQALRQQLAGLFIVAAQRGEVA
jgi:hypothetical protein